MRIEDAIIRTDDDLKFIGDNIEEYERLQSIDDLSAYGKHMLVQYRYAQSILYELKRSQLQIKQMLGR